MFGLYFQSLCMTMELRQSRLKWLNPLLRPRRHAEKKPTPVPATHPHLEQYTPAMMGRLVSQDQNFHLAYTWRDTESMNWSLGTLQLNFHGLIHLACGDHLLNWCLFCFYLSLIMCLFICYGALYVVFVMCCVCSHLLHVSFF